MFWLDWLLFGDGHGMRSPFFDDVFYWLKDTSERQRKNAEGRFYRSSGGLGAQLYSIEWRMPCPGTRRVLSGHEFRVFHARRKWLRVEVSWAMTGLGRLSLDEQNAAIADMRAKLGSV